MALEPKRTTGGLVVKRYTGGLVVRTADGKREPQQGGKATKSKRFSVTLDSHLAGRLEEVAEMLGADPADLLRLIVWEQMPQYEERARRAGDELAGREPKGRGKGK
jgi:hypothetical protein